MKQTNGDREREKEKERPETVKETSGDRESQRQWQQLAGEADATCCCISHTMQVVSLEPVMR